MWAVTTAEKLSVFDLKILEQLQQDASLSTIELADRVGLSQSPCWRRVQRLKDEGFIKQEVAILDRHKFGESVIIYANLKMAKSTEDNWHEFLRRVDEIPELLECHTIFGEMDIMMKVMAYSLPWYQEFVDSVLLQLPGVVDIRSTVTLKELKATSAIPLPSLALSTV